MYSEENGNLFYSISQFYKLDSPKNTIKNQCDDTKFGFCLSNFHCNPFPAVLQLECTLQRLDSHLIRKFD